MGLEEPGKVAASGTRKDVDDLQCPAGTLVESGTVKVDATRSASANEENFSDF